MIANPEVEDLGDAKEFSKAWNGDKYENFRQSHINGDIPKYCKSCYSNK
jgi:hypothetical protein